MKPRFLRPPGALPEPKFLAQCIKCNKCLQVCPYRTIRMGQAGHGWRAIATPVIQARQQPCYLCMKCPPVCPTGALRRDLANKQEVRMGKAVVVSDQCLNAQGIVCRSCYQSCPIFDEAIRMDQELKPVVDTDKCVGCGICENVCPVEPAAIYVVPGDKP